MATNQRQVTGPKSAPTRGRPPALEGEQAEDDGERDRHDHVLQRRRGDAETLHRAQHRDGGRDDSIAVQQGGAEEAHGHEE